MTLADVVWLLEEVSERDEVVVGVEVAVIVGDDVADGEDDIERLSELDEDAV